MVDDDVVCVLWLVIQNDPADNFSSVRRVNLLLLDSVAEVVASLL